MQELTWKCYSPLWADYVPQDMCDDPDCMEEDGPSGLEGEYLTFYEDSIRDAIQQANRQTGDLAQYIHGDKAAMLDGKVLSIVPSVEVVNDELMGCATVKLCEPLDEQETAALTAYLTGQYSDGWGESFEQREIEVSDGTVFVHFWSSDYFQIAIDRHPASERENAPGQDRPVYTRPKMNFVGEDGNIYAILGRAARLLRGAGQEDRAQEMTERVTAAHSYNDALFIVSEYVETELSESIRTGRRNGEKTKGGDAR